MVEGGGLGRFRPEEIGPSDVQSRSGVIDVRVEDEAEAVAVARRYLGMFRGPVSSWEAPGDAAALRESLPDNRLRVYDIRAIVAALVDRGSSIELRRGFGAGIVTALARLEGRPIGVIANDPSHLGGAIDADGADKAARFLQLCDAHGLPIVSLIDTPGFMVGPEIQSRAVELGYRKELESAAPGNERESLRRRLVAEQHEKGKALNLAATLEIDAVIDPSETRGWLVDVLAAAAQPTANGRFIDPW